MKSYHFALLLGLSCLLGGCSYVSKNKDVSGKVQLDSGAAITKGQVCFAKDGMVLTGPINSDGTYKLNPASAKVGIPAGEYKVYLLSTEKMEGSGPQSMKQTPVIDPKYASPQSTDLTCTVGGSTSYDIKVPAYKAP